MDHNIDEKTSRRLEFSKFNRNENTASEDRQYNSNALNRLTGIREIL